MKKKLFWIVLIVIIIALGLFFYFKGKNKKINYKTSELERGEIASIVEATGEINPSTLVEVGCQVTGRIQKIYVDYNSRVKKGQMLAEIDPTKYQTQVVVEKATLEQAKRSLYIKEKEISKISLEIKRLKSQAIKNEVILINKKRTYERYNVLAQTNLIPQSDQNTAETEYLASKEDYSSSQSQLKESQLSLKIAEAEYLQDQDSLQKAQANLENALADLNYTKIISPIDGVVIARKVDEGQTVVSSYQTTTLFKIANDLTQMEVHAKINESDVGNISHGQKVSIKVDASPGKIFSGKIFQIRDEAKEIEKTIYYEAIIKVKNPELILKPGMTAQIEINTAFKKDVLKIPNEALRFIPTSPILQEKLKKIRSAKSNFKLQVSQITAVIWILKDKEPSPIEVVLGLSDNNFTELVNGHVKEKDKLITGEMAE